MLIFQNPIELSQKVKKLQSDGWEKLAVVSDFDRTLTVSSVDGQKLPSAIATIRNERMLPDPYAEEAQKLFETYHPYEVSQSLDPTAKSEKMLEWWSLHFELLNQSGLSQEVLQKAYELHPKIFREGVSEVLESLKEHKVPLLVFSAGLGDLITKYLKGFQYDQMHILSNFVVWDDNGKMKDSPSPMIHTMNKGDIAEIDSLFEKSIQKRENLILLGDQISDLEMARNIDIPNIISIGFLNEDDPELKKIYREKYDITVVGDGGIKEVWGLLFRS